MDINMKAEELRVKPNEIRLGNYFNVPRQDQSPFRVDVIDFMTKENTKIVMVYEDSKTEFPTGSGNFIHNHPLTWYLKDLSPIPLSEEVLLKCPEIKPSSWMSEMWTIREPKGQFHVVKMKGRFIFRGLGMSVVYVDTLHHLQNLVFVNTGQELKIEL